MVRKELIDLERKRTIYNFILKNPGLHERELVRRLNIPKTTLRHHLHYLKKNELITSRDAGKYVCYYCCKTIGIGDKKIINLLRQNTPRHIVLYFLSAIVSSQKEVSEEINKDPTTVSYHMKKLVEFGIIEPAPLGDGVVFRTNNKGVILRSRVGNEAIYRLSNPKDVYKILITFKKSLIDDVVNDVLDWIEFTSKEGLPKRLKNQKNSAEDFVDDFWEIFPHPYHS
jgi:DNA-binding transcriptional ArsR family regulator